MRMRSKPPRDVAGKDADEDAGEEDVAAAAGEDVAAAGERGSTEKSRCRRSPLNLDRGSQMRGSQSA
jgi:hypothetical protein